MATKRPRDPIQLARQVFLESIKDTGELRVPKPFAETLNLDLVREALFHSGPVCRLGPWRKRFHDMGRRIRAFWALLTR
jgi:hypothetical protein